MTHHPQPPTSDDFAARLRQSLADHQEPAPDDLWERIEAQLEAPLQPAPPQRHRLQGRRWAAAAAVALLMAGAGYVLMPRQQATTPTTEWADAGTQSSRPGRSLRTPAEQATPPTPEALPLPAERLRHPGTPGRPAAATGTPSQPLLAVLTPSVARTGEAEAATTTLPTALTTAETTAADTPQAPIPANTPATQERLQPATHPSTAHRQPARKAASRAEGLTLALYAHNSLTSDATATPVRMSDSYAQLYNVPTGRHAAPPVYLSNYSEKSHHHLPLTVGLSVGYSLSERWAVQSGLVYTRAASDLQLTMGASTLQTHQTLHYLGVPLLLRCNLWHPLAHEALTVYATAGGQADICLKADKKTEGVAVETPRDHTQFSLAAALGAAYQLAPRLALFGEAGGRWYPDNHSSVDTYFKAHPLAPSLQVGLRLNLGSR